LAAGDILGVYVEGVLPATVAGQTPPAPPVYFPGQLNTLNRRLPPAVGYPFPIRDDGTVALPQLDPISVKGKTLMEVQELIRATYVNKQILPVGRDRILITLMQPRQYRVMVFRQETGGITAAGPAGVIASSSKRNTGFVVDLPANENDVLSALSQTGGLPGLETYNQVIIFKGGMNSLEVIEELKRLPAGKSAATLADKMERVIIIPLRARHGEQVVIRQEDIMLESGDVVFLDARDVELYYTGGLLPAGEFVLPRDYDLDVVKAIAQVKGPLVNGAFGANNLAGAIIDSGPGNPSPSMLVVLRHAHGSRRQIPILVDLNKALRDPRESLLVQPGDVLILQEKPSEALARYFTRTFFNFSVSWEAIHTSLFKGVADFSTPERIPGRITVSQ
jgi:protein involved in polysaccharide export with SLBB domain